MTDHIDSSNDFSLTDYIGQTVTIFTTSGGPAGFGFTGVLVSVHEYYLKLLIKVGAPPECPLGSHCGYPVFRKSRTVLAYSGLGSIAVIPLDKITAFVYNAL
jgi:hypothetical protein